MFLGKQGSDHWKQIMKAGKGKEGVNEDKMPMAVSKRRKRRGEAAENKECDGDGD